MATIPTNVQIPSEKPQDVKFNAGNFDKILNSPEEAYRDRFGKARITYAGMEAEYWRVIECLGYKELGDWTVGLVVTTRDQVVIYNGSAYKYTGPTFPFTIAASAPDADWVNIGDGAVRSALGASTGAELIGYGDVTLSEYLLKNDSGAKIEYFYNFLDGDNWSPALQRAFDYFSSATKATIQFANKNYTMRGTSAYSGQANITLIGSGATILQLASTTTAIQISITSVRRIAIRDMEIDISSPSAGTKRGFYLNCTGQDASHFLQNLKITATIASSSTSVICLDIVNPSLSTFIGVYVKYFGTSAPYPGSNNIAWRLTANGKVSTDNAFYNCDVINAEIAFLCNFPDGFTSEVSYLEGISWTSCTIVGVGIGVQMIGVDSPSGYKSPMNRWIGGHIFAYKFAMDCYWVSEVCIDNTYFTLLYDSAISGGVGGFPINLNYTKDVKINNTSLGSSADPSPNKEGIHVGDGCNLTIINNVVYYNQASAPVVRTFPSSKNTRVGNCVSFYQGVAPANAVDLVAGTNNLDLGGNSSILDN